MEEPKSKSQKKREADYLQELGAKLVDLNRTTLEKFPLPASLRQAILDAKLIKSHGAARRQAQLIGKLMRSTDSQLIIEAYENFLAENSAKTASFHALEVWRKRLINEGNQALTEFINLFHPQDVQHLRFLIKKASAEQTSNQNQGASKELFRFLRSCLL